MDCLVGQTAWAVCWTYCAEEEARYGSLEVAFRRMDSQSTAEGLRALNENRLSVVSTWDQIRQSPSGHREPTMGDLSYGRFDGMAG